MQDDGGSGWYLVPNVGMIFTSDVTNVELGFPVNVSFDNGFMYGIGIGVEFDTHFRLQVDIGQAKNDLDTIGGILNVATGNLVTITGDITQTPILLSGVWEFGSRNIKPHFGIGIGGSQLKRNIQFRELGALTLTDNSNEWAFAYQFMAGIDFALSPSCDLNFDYRFMHMDYKRNSIENQVVSVGLRLRF